MTHVPASSRGLSTSGGTLTGPLVIAPADGNVVPLTIRAGWNAQNTDFLAVVNTDNGNPLLELDLSGNLYVADHTSSGIRTRVDPRSLTVNEAASVLTVSTGSTGLFSHALAAQPTLTSGTATPEQIALALQSYGAAGGT